MSQEQFSIVSLTATVTCVAAAGRTGRYRWRLSTIQGAIVTGWFRLSSGAPQPQAPKPSPDWVRGAAYTSGQIVTWAGNSYSALAGIDAGSSESIDPPNSPSSTSWRLGGSYTAKPEGIPDWSSALDYVEGDAVQFNGRFWLASRSNTAVVPAVPNPDWAVGAAPAAGPLNPHQSIRVEYQACFSHPEALSATVETDLSTDFSASAVTITPLAVRFGSAGALPTIDGDGAPLGV
jgi:hypothetical protein